MILRIQTLLALPLSGFVVVDWFFWFKLGVYSPKRGLLKVVTTRDGLPSDFVYLIKPDDEGFIWLGSEKVLPFLFDNHYAVKSDFHFNHFNGLTGVETNQNAVYLITNTNFWFLIDGLYRFNDRPQDHIRFTVAFI